MLDEDSYRLIFDQCIPVKPEQKSYEQLLEIFVHTPFAERIKFYESERGPEESSNEWVARVRRLAIQCEFDNHLETALRDKIICGFGKGPVLDRLLEEKITISLADAVKIANHKMEALSSFGCKNGQGQDGQQDGNPVKQEVLYLRSRQEQPGTNRRPGKVTQSTEASSASSELGYAVCGRRGHNKDKCYFSNCSCRYCNRKGHLENMCIKKRKRFRVDGKFKKNNFLVEENALSSNFTVLDIDSEHDELPLYSLTDPNDEPYCILAI
ncbi:uncharacterized protein LOC123318481 [Coccinella septempunctata]|uniref:uncharacterized protein LOC123318481 n=1 Tax=Coccinella septempunctata TaxID=41139 RepID=UPI001D068F41|nr:uncharacterized protein LOC123318481 [Coccinella septempunctata]